MVPRKSEEEVRGSYIALVYADITIYQLLMSAAKSISYCTHLFMFLMQL